MTFDDIVGLMRHGAEKVGFTDRLKFDCGPDGMIFLSPEGVSQDDAEADCTIRISTANLEQLIKGKLNPMTGVVMGKLKVSGNPTVALKLAALLKA